MLAEQFGQALLHISVPDIPGCIGCQAFPGVFINDVEDPESTSVMCPILHEVITPHMVWILRPQPDARSIVKPQSGAFWLFCRHFQPFFAPYSLYSLVVHPPSFVSEHRRDPSVSIAAVLARQLDDVFCEYFLVCGWMACVSLC
jgi:hypothetical protein